MDSGPQLRLVLPHQLFEQHLLARRDTVFVLIEHDLLFRQYDFHAHKLVLHRASMARFARRLNGQGFEAVLLHSDPHRTSHVQLTELIRRRQPSRVSFFDVVDDWLERDLRAALEHSGYQLRDEDVLESPNFLTTRDHIDHWFANNPARMHDFYLWQRRRLNLLLDDDGGPLGGKWSFDADNRKKLPRDYAPRTVRRFANHPGLHPQGSFDLESLESLGDAGETAPGDAGDAGDAGETAPGDAGDAGDASETAPEVVLAIKWVSEQFPNAPGDPHSFSWPTSAAEARTHLREFVRERLRDFGPYEDAISTEHPFIAHSLLTPPLNIGLLDPREVIQAVFSSAEPSTPLASVEGFVRQLIGWREYMRANYRVNGRRLRRSNHLHHQNQLGEGWWDASTGLAPVDLVISRVLATGYAHHIERLMVLGNAMSLLRINPHAVYQWFMEMFVDAYDWVMVPNVYAMSQFAAGAAMTTKSYVSGSHYLRKMSDLPAGEWTADWDALYWSFIAHHRPIFLANSRAHMTVFLLERMEPHVWAEHRRRAQQLLNPQTQASRLIRGPVKEPSSSASAT